MEGKQVGFEIKVGIFVFIGILIMFIIVFSIGEFYVLRPVYRIKVMFGFANGLAVGAPVRLAGIKVGDIEEMKVYYDKTLKKTRIEVLAKIKKEAQVEKNAVYQINTLGLLGEKYLEITPGTAEAGFMQNEDVIEGKDPVPMEEVTKNMKEMSDNIKDISESAKVVMARLEKGEGTIGKLLTDETIYNDMEDFVSDIKAHPWKLLSKGSEGSGNKHEAGTMRYEKEKGNKGILR